MAKSIAPKAEVSAALKETVLTHPNIQKVYFRTDGLHYFEQHKHDVTGKFYGQIEVSKKLGKNGVTETVQLPVLKTLIVSELTREEILG